FCRWWRWPWECHRTQAAAVELGVGKRCVERTMAQHIGDLFERTAAIEQPPGNRVAQQVRSGMGQPCALVCLADRLAYQVRSDQLLTRGDTPYEDGAVSGLRSLILQVGGDGLSCSLRQRQHLLAAALRLA